MSHQREYNIVKAILHGEKGVNNQLLKINEKINAKSSVNSNSLTEKVIATTHGLRAVDLPIALYKNTEGVWKKSGTQVDAIAYELPDPDTILIVRAGKMKTTGMGLSSGTTYYLVNNNGDGFNYTPNEPTAPGSLYKELFRTGTSNCAEVNIQMGIEITDAVGILSNEVQDIDGTLKRVKVSILGAEYWLELTPATSVSVATPSGLSATTFDSGRIDLVWVDNSNNEAAYEVQESPNGNQWTIISDPNLPANTTSYSHTGLEPGKTIYYRVIAKGNNVTTNDSNPSNVDSATTNSIKLNPPVVSSKADAAMQVTISWGADVNSIGWALQHSLDGVTYNTIANPGTGVTSFIHRSAAENALNYYRIKAIGDGVKYTESDYATTSISTPSSSIVMQPTNQYAVPWAHDEVRIHWDKPAAGSEPNYYEVEYATDTTNVGTYKVNTNINNLNTFHYVKGLSTASVIYVRAYAVINGIKSAPVDWIEVFTRPEIPTGLVGVANSSIQITLNWDDNIPAPDLYHIRFRKDGVDGNGNSYPWEWKTDLTASTYTHTSYQGSPLTTKTGYQYQVRADDNGLTSGLTATIVKSTL